MKNKFLLPLLLLFQFAFAGGKDSLSVSNPFTAKLKSLESYGFFDDDCDVCGCSASGGSMGFSSILNSNFVGLRYFYQAYRTNDKLYTNSKWYDENYNTIQIWSRIPLTEKIQVSALIPYHINNRETATGKQSISGFGDITVLGNFRIFQTSKDSAFVYHKINVGGGVKMPVGTYNAENNGSVNPSFQLGTGSWDYLFITEYSLKRNNFGLDSMLNYVLKTENAKEYRYGNQFNYSGTFFYLLEKDKLTMAPHLGIAGEIYEQNYQHGEKVRNTAGDVLFGKMGFEVERNKFSFGASLMLPIAQDLTGGRVESQHRYSLNLNYVL